MIVTRIFKANMDKTKDTINEFIKEFNGDEWYAPGWFNPESYPTHYFQPPFDAFGSFTNKYENTGIILGAVDDNDSSIYRIEFLYVRPDFRNNGHGKGLKEFIVHHAKANDYKRINSYIKKDNKGALSLNHRAGWSIYNITDTYYDFTKKLK
jgi:ribosomal protein S18 acetylase RimI-like enzyme